MTVCLVACASEKASRPLPSRELYVSSLFQKSRQFAQSRFDKWFILSAKYGLLHPDKVIQPYEKALTTLSRDDREEWSRGVGEQLLAHTGPKDWVCFLAGQAYREYVVPLLASNSRHCIAPLADLGIGRQLQWLTRVTQSSQRLRHLDRLYELLDRLATAVSGPKKLGDCDGTLQWPEKGLYFFFEDHEYRITRLPQRRIVRVGTHAVSRGSRSTLWGRLRTHRGDTTGLGNHRGSIFRLHVGAALIQRGDVPTSPTWGLGQSASALIRASEAEIESAVSEYLAALKVLWLPIGDQAGPESDRSYLEMNTIALLSGEDGPLDRASLTWLGRRSAHAAIRTSGLWNVNYIAGVYEPEFLDVLDAYVVLIEKGRPLPTASLAPVGWHQRRPRTARDQRSLFEANIGDQSQEPS